MKILDPSLSPEMEAHWKALRRKGVTIPEQPKVLLEIEAMSHSANLQARLMAELIGQDPGLTARLLYIVNSPTYGLVERVSSIEETVFILGVNRVVNLCRAAMLRVGICPVAPGFEIFWDRSAIIAELTAAVAHRQRTGVGNDLAYMAGLFHACGVAVLAKTMPDYCDALGTENAWTQLEEHDRRFGVDHVLVSYLVARHWRLPELVADAVLHQRGPAESGHQCTSLVASMQFALLIYNRMFLGDKASEWEATRDRSRNALGMTDAEMARFA